MTGNGLWTWCGRRESHSHAPEGTSFWGWRVCIPPLPRALPAGGEGQSLPGVPTPGPGGTKAGGPPGREALCRRGDLHPHASRHRVLGPACLRSTTSASAPPVGAGWSPPAVLVPRTGFEPVISSLRGRRVGQLHQRGLGSGRHHGGMGRPARCGACRTRTDRLLIASEVLFLMS